MASKCGRNSYIIWKFTPRRYDIPLFGNGDARFTQPRRSLLMFADLKTLADRWPDLSASLLTLELTRDRASKAPVSGGESAMLH